MLQGHPQRRNCCFEEPVVLQKEGRRYPALRAAYGFEGLYDGKAAAALFSVLLLIDAGEKWVKLRSSTPVAPAASGRRGQKPGADEPGQLGSLRRR